MDNRPLQKDVYDLSSSLFGSKSVNDDQFIKISTVATVVATTTTTAVLPAITQEAFSATMSNYRRYIASYNFKTNAENEINDRHNKTVNEFLKKNPPNEIQVQLIKMFRFRNSNLTAREWNAQADLFCNEHGLMMQKKKVQTVKYGTELVFQNMLHLYNTQLIKRNCNYESLMLYKARPLQRLEINAHLIKSLKRDDTNSVNLCTKSIRSHRQRLEEAGVFVDYHFSGRQRPVKVHINPDILCIFDLHTGKNLNTENQPVSLEAGNVLPDTNESTGTNIKECKRKANVENNSLDKEFAPLTPNPFVFYKNTTGNVQNPADPPRADDVKVSSEIENNVDREKSITTVQDRRHKTPSEKLAGLIMHPQDLAEQIAAGNFANYTPIPIRELFNEAFYGTMNREDFRELVIQDFFKQAAKLYRNSTPYVGSWKIAINAYYDNKFKAFTNNSFNKHLIINDITELRWRLNYAQKWFRKNHEVRVLYPGDYFDMTRQTAKEVGFEYTQRFWKKHQQYTENSELRKRRLDAAAEKRKRTINYSKRFDEVLRKFFRDKITYTQLFDYVAKNLPQQYIDALPNRILQQSLDECEKTIYNDFVQYKIDEL